MDDYTKLGLIGAAGSVIGGLINSGSQGAANKANLEIAKEYNKGQKELAEYQAQYNERMWHMQNEYNTPSAQMERFRQAGLNPNLVYGQGNPGNAVAHPTYPDIKQTAPSIKPVVNDGLGLGGAVNTMLQVRAMALDNKKREQNLALYPYQEQLQQLKVFNESVKQTLQNQQVARNQKQLTVLDDLLKNQVAASKETLNNIIRKGELMHQDLFLKDEANQRAWRAMGQRDRALAIQSSILALKRELQERLLPGQEQKLAQEVFKLEKENSILAIHKQFEEKYGSKNANMFIQFLRAFISTYK